MALTAVVACVAGGGEALGCPSCPTSRLVSALVCGETFWIGLAATLAPVAAFGALAVGLHRIGPLRSGSSNPRARQGGA